MSWSSLEQRLSVLGLLGAALLLAGALGPWLDFPLTASLYPRDLGAPWLESGMLPVRSILLGIAVLAGIGWLSGIRLLMLIAGLAAAMVLLYFVHSWLSNEQWLPRYLSESEQREAVEAFITQYYWPNLNPEPTSSLETDFEYLSDQLQVFWYSSGWGFGFCLVGMILLLLDHQMTSPAAGATSATLLLLFGIVGSVLIFPLFNADLKQRRGDELLAAGRLREAISSYETTLRMNPVLRVSERFLLKASRAYYQLEGDHSRMGGYYLVSSRDRWVIGQPLSDAAKQDLEDSVKILSNVMVNAYQGSPLERAILQRSIEEYRKIRIQQGLNAYAEGQVSLSLGLLQEVLRADQSQLHAGFYLAHMQRELGLFPEAISTLDETLHLVDHDSIRADLLCTLGDAYSQGGHSLQARAAYVKCIKADSLYNFRAVLDLGGT